MPENRKTMTTIRRRTTCALLALPLVALAHPALAEDDDAAPREPIVVTGRGLSEGPATPAYDVQTIARDKLVSSASGRIEDVLASVAGFQQFRRSDSRSSNPSNQGVTLRALGGNASSRAQVLLDGVPVANPFFGYIPLSALTPDRLGSVRVTRGGGMGAFGTGAVSGTIEMESASPDELGPVSAEALVNNRGETQGSLTVAPRLGEGFVVAGVQWDRGQGFWTTPKDQRVAATARAKYESLSGSLRAVAPLTDNIEVQASGLVYDDARTLRFKGADSTSSGQQGSLRFVGRGDWQFDVLGFVQAQDFSNIVISSTSYKKTLDQAKTPTLAVGGKAELRPPVGESHVLRIGTDVKLSRGNLVEAPYSAVTGLATAFRKAGGQQSDLGFYIEDDWTIGQFVLTAGGRLDRWTITDGYYHQVNPAGVVTQDTRYADRDGWNANGRGGIVWNAGTAVSLRAAAYTGLRLPTLNELYRPFVVFPITTNANAGLKPERLRGYEAGVDFHPSEALNLSLTAFDNYLKDAIANVTLSSTVRERQNVDSIHARGIEASADLKLGKVDLSGSLSWTDAKVKATAAQIALDGMRPAQVPKLAASGTVAWAPADGWRLAATLRRTGAQYEDDLQVDTLPAATTLDLYAQVPITRFASLVLRAENLTDETIVTRNAGGSMDLGQPRTLWAGFKLGLH